MFGDPFVRIFNDPDHSPAEEREIIIGHYSKRRLLLTWFIERRGRIRIIGSRQASKPERRDCEENKKQQRY